MSKEVKEAGNRPPRKGWKMYLVVGGILAALVLVGVAIAVVACVYKHIRRG